MDKRDGYDYDGYKLRVEFPKGNSRDDGGFDRRGGGRGFGRDGGRGGGRTTRRSQYRVLITGTLRLLFTTERHCTLEFLRSPLV